MAQFSLRNQQYSVLALYGIEHDPVSTAEFYAAIVQWCDRLGCIPNKSLVHGDGFSGKCISFKHNNKYRRDSRQYLILNCSQSQIMLKIQCLSI
jgi:hypothetical protein